MYSLTLPESLFMYMTCVSSLIDIEVIMDELCTEIDTSFDEWLEENDLVDSYKSWYDENSMKFHK